MATIDARARTFGAHRLWANVSITARPLFEAHGFAVQAEQHPMIGGVELTNFRMSRELRQVKTALQSAFACQPSLEISPT